MVTQLKLAIMAIVTYLSLLGLAHAVVKDSNHSGNKPSLMDFLGTDNELPVLARYQLFPRDGTLTVTVTNSFCSAMPSQDSSIDSGTFIGPTSSRSYSSALPSTSMTLVPSSSSVSSSTLASPSSTPVTAFPTSSTQSGTSTPSSTTLVKSSSASSSVVSPSSSSPQFSSASSPAVQPTSQFTGSGTTGDPTTTGTSASATPPPQQGIASRQTRVQGSVMTLVVLANILVIHGFGNAVV